MKAKQQPKACACGCGGFPKSAKSKFLPGHDMKLLSHKKQEKQAKKAARKSGKPTEELQPA